MEAKAPVTPESFVPWCDPEMLQVLLEHKADINAWRGINGWGLDGVGWVFGEDFFRCI